MFLLHLGFCPLITLKSILSFFIALFLDLHSLRVVNWFAFINRRLLSVVNIEET